MLMLNGSIPFGSGSDSLRKLVSNIRSTNKLEIEFYVYKFIAQQLIKYVKNKKLQRSNHDIVNVPHCKYFNG